MHRALAVAISSLALMGLAHASAHSENLLDVYRDALHSDPQIQAAKATLMAAREARPEAWAALLPQITGTAQVSRQKSTSTTAVAIPNSTTGNVAPIPYSSLSYQTTRGYTLQLRQSVFSWAHWMTLKRSGKQVAQADVTYQAAEQDLIVRVTQRYFAVLAAQASLDAQQTALRAIQRQLDEANKRYQVGLVAITDVQNARAARDNARAAVISAKRALATARQALRAITGREYDSLARPSDDMPLLTPQPANVQSWVDRSMDQNLTLIASRLAADIARDNVRIALGSHVPSIDLVAQRNESNADIDLTTSRFGPTARNTYPDDAIGNSISLQITVPIFSGGLAHAQVRESQYHWIAAKDQMTQVSRQTEQAARDAYLGVISEVAQVRALKQGVQSAQTSLAATQAGYQVGTRTAVDVLTARQVLVQARTNYAQSRYDYINDIIQLRQAAGSLDRQTLQQINGWLTVSQSTRPTSGLMPPPATEQPQAQPQSRPHSPTR